MKGIKLGKYTYYKSNRPSKKLMVNPDGSVWIYFGDSSMQHYQDKTGLLDRKLNHMDDDRRRLYLARASKIKDKNGNLTKDNQFSSNYHAIRVLW
jgi:hypothetical protein